MPKPVLDLLLCALLKPSNHPPLSVSRLRDLVTLTFSALESPLFVVLKISWITILCADLPLPDAILLNSALEALLVVLLTLTIFVPLVQEPIVPTKEHVSTPMETPIFLNSVTVLSFSMVNSVKLPSVTFIPIVKVALLTPHVDSVAPLDNVLLEAQVDLL
jgi:hypothetical protein